MTWWDVVFLWESSLLCPVIAVGGIVTTFLVLTCMPQTSIGSKLKLYYILMTVCNMGPLIFNYCVYIPNALWLASNGKIELDPISWSPIVCKFSWFAAGSGEGETAWLLALLAFERAAVTAYPFRASVFSMRRTTMFCICAVVVLTAFNAIAFYAYGVPDTETAADVNPGCTPKAEAAGFLIATCFINYVAPNFLLLILTGLIMIALARHRRESAGIVGNMKHVQKRQLLGTTTTILSMAAIRCSFFIPYSVLYATWRLVPDSETSNAIRYIANYFLILAGFCQILDFVVWCAQLPNFARKVRLVLTCGAWRASRPNARSIAESSRDYNYRCVIEMRALTQMFHPQMFRNVKY